MGNPLQDATNALGEIINNVQTLRTEIELDVIQPLQALPRLDIGGMDTAHDQCLKSVQSSLEKLYGSGNSFKGAAADAVSQLMHDYLVQENKLNSGASYGVTEYMVQLEQLCRTTVDSLQPPLDALKGIPNENILISDTLNYWSDVFNKGPQELILGLRIGPWELEDFPPAHFLLQGAGMGGQQMQYEPQGQIDDLLVRSFWSMVAEALAPFAAVVLVVNLVTEAIKQGKLEWDLGNVGWLVMRWVQQMEELHNQILLQNSSSGLPADAQNIIRLTNNDDRSKFLLTMSCGMPGPNLSPDQEKQAKDLFNKYNKLYKGVVTLTEIEYLVAKFGDRADLEVSFLAEMKVQYPQLLPGYLVYFMLQDVTQEQIVVYIRWLVTASQNSRGDGPGNIFYMKGTVLSNPVVDFVTVNIYDYEASSAQQLRIWQQQILNDRNFDYRTLPGYENLPEAVITFFKTTVSNRNQLNRYNPRDPSTKLPGGYDGLFGTALQEMIKQKMRAFSWYKQYIGKYGQTSIVLDEGSGLRPDLKVRLPGGPWAVWDYTTYEQRKTKDKYNGLPHVRYNIVLIHNGPYGSGEYDVQNTA